MKIIVTGGAGFIGSNVVDELISNNNEVCVIDNLSTGKLDNLNYKARYYKQDITNIDVLKLIFEIEKPEIVYHFAAQIDVRASLKKPAIDANINIVGTINVLECCRKYQVKKIIYPSSAAVYGNPKYLPVDEKHPIEPISFYGISKHTPEHYIKTFCSLYCIKYTIFRFSNVYGIRQDPKGEGGVVSIFIDKFLNNESVFIYGDGEQTRDFIYVKDIAEANLLALNLDDNKIINISTNVPVTVNKLYEIIKRILKSDVQAIHKEPRQGEILFNYLDNTLAKKILRWKAKYTIEDGVSETIAYYKNLYSSKNKKLSKRKKINV